VLGKSGSGKSSLLKYMSQQDIEADRGFVYFDLHGDATPFLLRSIAARERRLRRHLSDKLVVIAPGDPELSVGLNPLEQESPDFVRIAEFAELLKHRWHLNYFGARTDELLRNSLYVLSANGLTLLELAPFLTHSSFRTACLKRVTNIEIRQYFESRYDQFTEMLRVTMREPILNKTSAFTADPHFRHIVGQEHSTFSLKQAMDEGHWIIVDLQKGKLGEQALTLGSLIFAMLKNALFTREKGRFSPSIATRFRILSRTAVAESRQFYRKPASSVWGLCLPTSSWISIRPRCGLRCLQSIRISSSSFRARMQASLHRPSMAVGRSHIA
jgi:hypothetical protein